MDTLRKVAAQIGASDQGPPPGVAEAALRAWVKGEMTQDEYAQTIQVNVGETAKGFEPARYPAVSQDLIDYVRRRSRGDGQRDPAKHRVLGAWLHAARRILVDNNHDETLLAWALPTCQRTGLTQYVADIEAALGRYARIRPPEWFESAQRAHMIDMEAKRREGT
jgi:hypothetical protein